MIAVMVRMMVEQITLELHLHQYNYGIFSMANLYTSRPRIFK